jgi:phosphomannomutase/phosphoglucomutase
VSTYTPPDYNRHTIRQYDIRGKAERDLHDGFATALGHAFGTRIRRNGGQKVAVGRDCRLSGPRIQAAFTAGVNAAGVDVVDVGVVPTPLVYFALHHLDLDGACAITGSHNPGDENGFKMCEGKGALYGDGLLDLARIIDEGDLLHGDGGVEVRGVNDDYQRVVVESLRPGGKTLKVVVDGGNGAGGPVAVPLYRALGFEVVELFCEMDGSFPNHHPDPTVEANLVDLKAAVAREGADLGIALDGDGDRIGAIDAQGRVVWGDQLLIFFARALLEQQPGARIVSEVKCSRVLYDDIRAHGGEAEMWKVGHSLIKARMKETGALIAGEMSGHFFFADRFFGFDDGPYAGARLLELLSNRPESLADLLDSLPKTVTTPELRVSCPDGVKFDVVERAVTHFKGRYDVFDLDGARIEFPNGWGLVRPSNTGPVLVMRFEADTAENLAAYRGEVEDWLRANAPEVDVDGPATH